MCKVCEDKFMCKVRIDVKFLCSSAFRIVKIYPDTYEHYVIIEQKL